MRGRHLHFAAEPVVMMSSFVKMKMNRASADTAPKPSIVYYYLVLVLDYYYYYYYYCCYYMYYC